MFLILKIERPRKKKNIVQFWKISIPTPRKEYEVRSLKILEVGAPTTKN